MTPSPADDFMTGDPVFCPQHGWQIRSADGLHDAPCGACEFEIDHGAPAGECVAPWSPPEAPNPNPDDIEF